MSFDIGEEAIDWVLHHRLVLHGKASKAPDDSLNVLCSEFHVVPLFVLLLAAT
jgi:hypothetical protein